MLSRLLVVIVGIPIVFIFLWINNLSRFLFFSIVSICGQYEFFHLFQKREYESSTPLLEFVLGTNLLFLTLIMQEEGIILGVILSILLLATLIVLRGFTGTGRDRFASGISSILFIPFPLSFFLLVGKRFGFQCLAGVILLVWALDIGAYIVGCSIRGPKLAPVISPNKTISGAIGGTIACFLAAWGLFSYGMFPISAPKMLLLTLLLSFFGQIGDLFESVLKREAGVKDASNIFKNHGGMLDRLDSVLLAGPISYLIMK